MPEMRRRAIIAVVGGGNGTAPRGSVARKLAERVGQEVARRGPILLCGGGAGVMEAAAVAAHRISGCMVGIMKEASGGAKKHLRYMVWTGLGDARNFVNAAAADAMIALEGGPGTLSEVALALKLGKKVACLNSWQFLPSGFPVTHHTDAAEAVAWVLQQIGADEEGFVQADVTYPPFPDQTQVAKNFVAVLSRW